MTIYWILVGVPGIAALAYFSLRHYFLLNEYCEYISKLEGRNEEFQHDLKFDDTNYYQLEQYFRLIAGHHKDFDDCFLFSLGEKILNLDVLIFIVFTLSICTMMIVNFFNVFH